MDPDVLGVALFVGGVLALGVLVRFGLPRAQRLRAGNREAWAGEHGYRWQQGDPEGFLAQVGEGLARGQDAEALGVLRGPRVALVDVVGHAGSGAHAAYESAWDRVPLHGTLAVAERPRPGPEVAAEPRGLASMALSAILPEVPTGDAAFDARFVVRARDPAEAQEVLTPGVRRALLKHPRYAYRFTATHVALRRDGLAPNRELGRMAEALQELLVEAQF